MLCKIFFENERNQKACSSHFSKILSEDHFKDLYDTFPPK